MTGLPARLGIKTDRRESVPQEHDPRWLMWHEMPISVFERKPSALKPVCLLGEARAKTAACFHYGQSSDAGTGKAGTTRLQRYRRVRLFRRLGVPIRIS